jgi:hypothetical protein
MHADIYADTSPARLLPLGTRYTIVSGDLDPLVPKRFGEAFAAKARATHESPHELEIAGVEHFELTDPQSDAWTQIVAEIVALAK